MKTGQFGLALPSIRTTYSVILFWVGPHRMGIEARVLKEIRKDDYRSPQESGGMTIISAHELFGVANPQAKKLLVLRPGRVAIRVDRVDRMIEIAALRPLPLAFQGEERKWYRGYAFDGEIVFPVLNPEQFECSGKGLINPSPMSIGVIPEMRQEVETP